ncbi:MAG: peptidylprolyl isomerase [Acidobacteriota bacterium]
MKRLRASLLLALALPALALPALDKGVGQQLADGLYARITTNKGVIVARLEPDQTPLAVASFVGLAEGTIDNEAFEAGVPYYDGSVFHRVVEGHVIQAGMPDPDRSDARGPGYTYPNEINAGLSHDHAGALGIANSGPHTNGAQFYITLGDRSYLDGTYIVFGEVVEGMDVVNAIVQGDVIESVRIIRQGAAAEDYSIDTEGFRALVADAEDRVMEVNAQRFLQQRIWVASNIDGRLAAWDGELRVLRVRRGRGDPLVDGDQVQIRYLGTAVVYRGHMIDVTGPLFSERSFAGNPEDGTPQADELNAEPFSYEVGSDTINPGFDQALHEMRRGGQAVVIVPAQEGYGDGGFYGPDRPQEPRFVIPPETLIVYAISVLRD